MNCAVQTRARIRPFLLRGVSISPPSGPLRYDERGAPISTRRFPFAGSLFLATFLATVKPPCENRRMTRRYGQYCGLARALELVGGRWSLLIVRELLTGPKRFSELEHELPGIATNVLSTRLRELEEAGLVRRSLLAPASSSVVYGLTPYGLALEEPIVHLGMWGSRSLGKPEEGDFFSPGALAIALRGAFRPAEAKGDDLAGRDPFRGGVPARQRARRAALVPARSAVRAASGPRNHSTGVLRAPGRPTRHRLGRRIRPSPRGRPEARGAPVLPDLPPATPRRCARRRGDRGRGCSRSSPPLTRMLDEVALTTTKHGRKLGIRIGSTRAPRAR